MSVTGEMGVEEWPPFILSAFMGQVFYTHYL